MSIIKRSTLLLLSLFLVAMTYACSEPKTNQAPRAPARKNSGIEQIIQTRDGNRGVWGMTITLSDFQFNPVVRDNQLSIIDEKYDRETKEIMTWSVDESRHNLRIEFKPGMGDFGSGNDVHVILKRAALNNYTGPDDLLEWGIPTDPM